MGRAKAAQKGGLQVGGAGLSWDTPTQGGTAGPRGLSLEPPDP